MTTAQQNPPPTLTWRRGSQYHITSECGRFAISRANVLGRIQYIAFSTQRGKPAVEIACKHLGETPDQALRDAAIAELKTYCQERA